MKQFFIKQFLVAVGIFAALFASVSLEAKEGHVISINISPARLPTGECVFVEQTLGGNDKGVSRVVIPKEAEQLNITAKGKLLRYNTTKHPHTLEIFYRPDETVKLQYLYCSKNRARDIGRSIIESRLIYLPLESVIAIPDIDHQAKVRVAFDLSTFPKQFSAVTSFNTNTRHFTVEESMRALIGAALIIGELDVKRLNVNNRPVFFVTDRQSASKKALPRHLIKLIRAHREYWQDNDFKHYVVFALTQSDRQKKGIFKGVHFQNFISTLISDDILTSHHSLCALSHELGHAWLAYKIKSPHQSNNLLWFFEGFNDYLGLRLATENKVASIDQMLDVSNLEIRKYALSPVKEATAQESEHYYRRVGEYNEVAQIRGHFIAKALHQQYPLEFDNAMKALHGLYQAGKVDPLTIHDIDRVFNKHFGQQVWAPLREQIYSGKELSFSPNLFRVATRNMVSVDSPDFGFDTQALLQKNVIKGVNKKSNAHRAGLRDGQHIEDYRVYFGFADRVATINIVENGKRREIVFKPNVVKKVIPQYVRV